MDTQALFGNNTVLTILIATIAYLALIGYFIYRMIQGAATPTSGETYVIPDTTTPVHANKKLITNNFFSTKPRFPGTDPSQAPGIELKEFTISFWIYIDRIVSTTPYLRHILHVGDNTDYTNIDQASPVIALDPTENKMYVNIAGISDTNATTPYRKVMSINENSDTGSRRGILIDYVPMQRWVHVAIVASDKTKTLSSYMDGEFIKTVKVAKIDVTPVSTNLAKKASIGGVVGQSVEGFDGLISNVRMHTWNMTLPQIREEYKKGPVEGVLARLGLGSYGLRSPIYPATMTAQLTI